MQTYRFPESKLVTRACPSPTFWRGTTVHFFAPRQRGQARCRERVKEQTSDVMLPSVLQESSSGHSRSIKEQVIKRHCCVTSQYTT